ncbi:hypothetical protein BpHYR1_050249 [Brachionus plicatilis]|uniref:Uncharacterized protein n=1 Tax=Brachionus plicatilis TaxID=10195 RepID=A0A3M7RJR4_BRAPC|nr:hypothetical protein BpHYR1_050249 [Brachionus plicatilis]
MEETSANILNVIEIIQEKFPGLGPKFEIVSNIIGFNSKSKGFGSKSISVFKCMHLLNKLKFSRIQKVI